MAPAYFQRGAVRFAAFNLTGSAVATTCADNMVRLWNDLGPPGTMFCQPLREREQILHLAFSSDQRQLVTASFNGYMCLSFGHGDGTFDGALLYNQTVSAAAIAVADVDHGGASDLVFVDKTLDTLSIRLSNVCSGNATFAGAATYSVGTLPKSVATGDVNGDGVLDVVTANNGTNNVSVLIGSTSGTFGSLTNYTTGLGPAALALADFNGDGLTDILRTEGGASAPDAKYYHYINNGMLNFYYLNYFIYYFSKYVTIL